MGLRRRREGEPAPVPVATATFGPAASESHEEHDLSPSRQAEILVDLADDLAAVPTGLDFVYLSLDRVRQRCGADDVVLVLDEAPLGRQAYRCGRRPVDSDWSRDLVKAGAVGLHSTPGEIEPSVAAGVANLCSLAVRLDVAHHDSLHDALTGLLNRRAFDELLSSACGQARRYGWAFALVVIDLDHFKVVNDRLGHSVGDATLQAVGAELRSQLRVGDVAARLGGDEFALILPSGSSETIPALLTRVQDAVEQVVPGAAALSFSAGVATAPDDGTEPASLFRIADHRLYQRKRAAAGGGGG